MEPQPGISTDRRGAGPSTAVSIAASSLNHYDFIFSASSLLHAPLATLLEYSGVVAFGLALNVGVLSLSSSEADRLLSSPQLGMGRPRSGSKAAQVTQTPPLWGTVTTGGGVVLYKAGARLMAIKVGMMTYFDPATNNMISVTIVGFREGDNVVIQVKTSTTDGYDAI
ncbi:hypothetical protein GUJ93_ZPchr0002g24716 [Zizania palustris]|uniref:Uncharacterized protein n=1 Tax=Zizania palustris TaxID=103762 RepID=A0A8J5RZT0_ZIZPA|nr:hypothetical protein GUJ93_ZPchr0002g24716 [Zizania palustris]